MIINRVQRPIDKRLVFIGLNAVNATQQATNLLVTTFPGTIVGLRWTFAADQDGGSGSAIYSWAIVVIRDGNNATIMGASNGADFYTPEQDVLAFGHGINNNNLHQQVFDGSTKTMRKMLGGDVMAFIVRGVATNTTCISGIVQFFLKT